MARPFGIKLEIDGKINPRDVTLGTKVIILVPQKCKTVQDVKKHVAENVLKTPVPLNFYIGEYRLRDEDDVLVFTCFQDPCRVTRAGDVKTPCHTLQNSVTPTSPVANKAKNSGGPATKRVKFNDTPVNVVTSSPLPNKSARDAVRGGFDQIDESNIRYPVDDSSTVQNQHILQSPPVNVMEQNGTDSIDFNNGMIVDDSLQLAKALGLHKKKKRKRRHRRRKTELNSEDDSVSEQETQSTPTSTPTTIVIKKDAGKKNYRYFSTNGNPGTSFYENNETDSPEEDLSFKKPVEPQRKPILRNKSRGQTKNYCTSGSGGIPPATDNPDTTLPVTPVSKRGKSRQDTPVLPRVLKNPGIFELAQQNLGSRLRAFDFFNSSIAEGSETAVSPTAAPSQDLEKDEIALESDEIKTKMNGNEQDENFYDHLEGVQNPNDINVGDVIAFKIIEMDEKYCPTLSPYKEAVVVLKIGECLTLNYTKKKAIERTGIFEINDEEFVGDQIDDNQLDLTKLLSIKIVKPNR